MMIQPRAFRNPGFMALMMALVSCATPPTVTHENPDRKVEAPVSDTQASVAIPSAEAQELLKTARAPVKIMKDTVVVDARSSFDYSMAHIPRSVQVRWSDYTEHEISQRGVLQRDLFAAARRLARLGISPQTQVVVVGSGLNGEGEEGRVAWMLAYLGVADARFANIDSLGARLTNVTNETPLEALPIWKPEPLEDLNVSRAEIQAVVKNDGTITPFAYGESSAALLYKVVDVRLQAKKPAPIDAVHIPWKEFFDSSMLPKKNLPEILVQKGLSPSQRIVVLNDDGVASAAVTMVLRSLGYRHAGNYAGGLQDLANARLR